MPILSVLHSDLSIVNRHNPVSGRTVRETFGQLVAGLSTLIAKPLACIQSITLLIRYENECSRKRARSVVARAHEVTETYVIARSNAIRSFINEGKDPHRSSANTE